MSSTLQPASFSLIALIICDSKSLSFSILLYYWVFKYFVKVFCESILWKYFVKVFCESILWKYFVKVFCESILGKLSRRTNRYRPSLIKSIWRDQPDTTISGAAASPEERTDAAIDNGAKESKNCLNMIFKMIRYIRWMMLK